MAAQGIKINGYDYFDSLTNFWIHALNYPKELAKQVMMYFPLSKDYFYKLQKEQDTDNFNLLDKAAIFYVLNRSSFSGSTLSGGMSPNHPRFTLSGVKKLEEFYMPNVNVCYRHFKESIPLHDCFMYLDPPYYIKNTLYGVKGDKHKDFEHELLYQVLKDKGNWIMSYNDCEEIRELYKNYKIINLEWAYGMNTSKQSSEILIISN